MLIKKILRKILEIKDHRISKVIEDTKKIIIYLDIIHRRRMPCSCCGRRQRIRDRLKQREWKHVLLWHTQYP